MINDNEHLKYGIELELILKLPPAISASKGRTKKVECFYTLIKDEFKKIPIEFSPNKEVGVYDKWIIMNDDSLECDDDYFTLELVSPIILGVKSRIDELQDILRVFKRYGATVNETCSFHLHISPKYNDFTLSHVKNICKFFAIYEKGLDLLNKDRVGNKFCNSNAYSKYLKDANFEEKNKLIDKTQNFKELVYLYNPVDYELDMFKERGVGKRMGNYFRTQRFYKLNLTNLLNERKTIEIRTHTGTTSIYEIVTWMQIWSNIVEMSRYITLV